MERLEFLYNPKALLEQDNEKYLLGASIPENTSKLLGEPSIQVQNDLEAEFDIEEKEIINRLKEDPLLIIKRMELKHMKIIEEYNKKRDEFSQEQYQLAARYRNEFRRKSSLSRSPERSSDPHTSYESKHLHHSRKHNYTNRFANKNRNTKRMSEADREERLRNMIQNGRLVQNERCRKFNTKRTFRHEPASCPKYLHEMRSKIDQAQISSLEERMRFIKN
ncbi:hypothetical protein OJ253_1004 [Cryptosporidium canis]|uniref:Uncharacterized protein n=1 Tax=Cryptosporidium canis TaxID=195482 RepID=A0A9D5HZG6_9CRYT|nr:hypothetical protein OJ253_1004 [Cryptosporidium canis]